MNEDNIKKILILFAHPSPDRSEVNKPMFDAASKLEHITCVDLYAEYPNYRINIDREQQRLREHEVIIFLFPMYWYSTPAILKEWMDLVFEYGFAYGSSAKALRNKIFLCALSAGGPKDAYKKRGMNHFTIRELLRPLEQTANLTGMRYLPPFTLFGARTAVEDGSLSTHIDKWIAVLKHLQMGKIDFPYYEQEETNTLNAFFKKLWGARDTK